ncbi:MAG: 1,4-dihydroxy-2-naphthoate octaprenyltransferase [Bdellovibrionota bacterium]
MTPKWKSVLLAFRPKTLTAALVPCLVGSAYAYRALASFELWVLIFAALAAFCIQIGTNLFNDAMDFKKGTDTHERIGPQRITQAGIMPYKWVLILAGLFFLAALVLGIPLVAKGGLPILIVGLVSIAMGYAYTGGPFPLAYLGLGDLFVILFFGIVAVVGMVFLHTGAFSGEAALLGLQVGLHAAVLIVINNMRDIEGDRKNHKKTLAVRMGIQKSRWEVYALLTIPFLINFYWLTQGYRSVFALGLLALPLAIRLMFDIKSTLPSPVYNRYLARAAGVHLMFGLGLALGFFL